MFLFQFHVPEDWGHRVMVRAATIEEARAIHRAWLLQSENPYSPEEWKEGCVTESLAPDIFNIS